MDHRSDYTAIRAANITAAIIGLLRKTWKVKMSTTVAYHPEGNGAVERFNRTIQDIVAKKLQNINPSDWPDLIPSAVLAHNMTPHGHTGMSPFNLMFGRRPSSLLFEEDAHPDADFQESEFQSLRALYTRRYGGTNSH